MMFSFPRLTFPYFQRRVYVFDLDETLFSIHPYVNQENKDDLHQWFTEGDEYGQAGAVVGPYGNHRVCYALFPQRMAALMKRIIANGDQIVFLTDGTLDLESVESFFINAYGIDKLPEGTECISTRCNMGTDGQLHDKKYWLEILLERERVPAKDIVFVDNREDYINAASGLEITVIHAKTNAYHEEAVVKEAAWLSDLEKNVCERTLAHAVPVLGTTVIGAAAGALIGATIGTACAGVGALPGAIIGGLLGAVIGYFAPQWITSCCCCCSSNEFEMATRAEFARNPPDAAPVLG